ncbi:MAG TPA: tRNA (5-methylaminomethyl-2-thiouridine)(34)-methyltransferase MnmD [Bacteroidales bacterium]|nr:tRNA (5-methylaminomethyl-2-thiouridine)(34)-methyltransferase MnmD [Bacteroidales bacterium]
MNYHLIITSDGSHTIYVPELNEHFHSVHGAVQESTHIFINQGLNQLHIKEVNILEIGFGTGLNALLTNLEIENQEKFVHYTTIEKFPLPDSTTGKLNFIDIAGDKSRRIFSLIHKAEWDTDIKISNNFILKKVRDDLTDMNLEGSFDLIYFDAFGPDKQPEMWTTDVFNKISGATKTGGVFVTYSAKGQVKRNLRACGFTVELLPGPPGKRQMIRAIKM